jgi:hypothetical protein
MSKCLPRFLFIPLDFRFSEFGHFQNNPKKPKKRSNKDQKKIKKRSKKDRVTFWKSLECLESWGERNLYIDWTSRGSAKFTVLPSLPGFTSLRFTELFKT